MGVALRCARESKRQVRGYCRQPPADQVEKETCQLRDGHEFIYSNPFVPTGVHAQGLPPLAPLIRASPRLWIDISGTCSQLPEISSDLPLYFLHSKIFGSHSRAASAASVGIISFSIIGTI